MGFEPISLVPKTSSLSRVSRRTYWRSEDLNLVSFRRSLCPGLGYNASWQVYPSSPFMAQLRFERRSTGRRPVMIGRTTLLSHFRLPLALVIAVVYFCLEPDHNKSNRLVVLGLWSIKYLKPDYTDSVPCYVYHVERVNKANLLEDSLHSCLFVKPFNI